MDKIVPANLRKCEITELDTNSKYFIARDLIDNTSKKVNLSGKQRFSYKDYKIGSIIYAAITIEGCWRLVMGTDFKRNKKLTELKVQVDDYFNNIDDYV